MSSLDHGKPLRPVPFGHDAWGRCQPTAAVRLADSKRQPAGAPHKPRRVFSECDQPPWPEQSPTPGRFRCRGLASQYRCVGLSDLWSECSMETKIGVDNRTRKWCAKPKKHTATTILRSRSRSAGTKTFSSPRATSAAIRHNTFSFRPHHSPKLLLKPRQLWQRRYERPVKKGISIRRVPHFGSFAHAVDTASAASSSIVVPNQIAVPSAEGGKISSIPSSRRFVLAASAVLGLSPRRAARRRRPWC